MKGRLSFFLGHLAISATLAVLVYILVFHFWYPKPLDKTFDIAHIFWMMIGIDVVLGPLLTLIVYKKNWKELRVDLTIIGLVQLAALGYAIYTMDAGRPAWLAFEKDRFVLTTKLDLLEEKDTTIAPPFTHVPLLGFGYANTNLEKAKDKSDLLFAAVFGVQPSQYPYMYEDLNTALPAIKKQAYPLSKLDEYNAPAKVKTILAKHPNAESYLPIMTVENQELTALLNMKAQPPVIAIVELKPW